MTYKCVICVAEFKAQHPGLTYSFLQNDVSRTVSLREEFSLIPDAITMVGPQPVCYDHIQVQRQSPLLIPTPVGA